MTTMNVSLPDSMKDFIDSRIHDGGYSTSSEYVRDLIRRDQTRLAEQHLAALLVEGLESGPAIAADDGYWQKKRDALTQRYAGK